MTTNDAVITPVDPRPAARLAAWTAATKTRDQLARTLASSGLSSMARQGRFYSFGGSSIKCYERTSGGDVVAGFRLSSRGASLEAFRITPSRGTTGARRAAISISAGAGRRAAPPDAFFWARPGGIVAMGRLTSRNFEALARNDFLAFPKGASAGAKSSTGKTKIARFIMPSVARLAQGVNLVSARAQIADEFNRVFRQFLEGGNR